MGVKTSFVSFRPVGARTAVALPIRRRTFVQAGALAPAGLTMLRAHAAPAPVRRSPGLRFASIDGGIAVIRDGDEQEPETLTWRLSHAAFGDGAESLPRTLQGGPKAGHELMIYGASFGTLPVFRHLFVFMLRERTWFVRLRTFMLGTEVTSEDVTLSDLSRWQAKTGEESVGGFVLRPSRVHLDMLERHVFDGHLRVAGAPTMLLDVNGVWHLQPGSTSTLTISPTDHVLSSAKFAWCEPASKPGSLAAAQELQFVAVGEATGRRLPFLLSPGQRPELRLLAEKEPSWRYLRNDWNCAWRSETAATPEARKRQPHPPGVSELTARWTLDINRGKAGHLGPVNLSIGTLTTTREAAGVVTHWFSGAVAPGIQPISSTIGQLTVKGWDQSKRGADGKGKAAPAGGLSNVPLVDIRGTGTTPPRLSTIDLPLLLVEAELVPEGCTFGELAFKPSNLNALYASGDREAQSRLAATNSYLWLGDAASPAGYPRASIDLTRARLTVSRAEDLAHLSFTFSGLYLQIGGGRAWLTDRRSACPLVLRDVPGAHGSQEPVPADTRAILVAEFPSQHVMEETLFRPEIHDWPEVALEGETVKLNGTDVVLPTALLPFLKAIAGKELADRTKLREAYSAAKIDREKQKATNQGALGIEVPFAQFSAEFRKRFEKELSAARRGVVEDQKYYCGPGGMDPDVWRIARATYGDLRQRKVRQVIDATLRRANSLAKALKDEAPPAAEPDQYPITRVWEALKRWLTQAPPKSSLTPEGQALLFENAIASELQEYGFFKEFYRQKMTSLRFGAEPQGGDGAPQLDPDAVPRDAQPWDVEYLSESVRPETWKEHSSLLDKRKAYVLDCYVREALDDAPLPRIMRARFARPSRLAFRIDCGYDAESRRRSRRGPASASTDLPFSFDALTEWSRLESAVTPRAVKLARFDEGGRASGQVDAPEEDSAPKSEPWREDVKMLELLRMRSGSFVTAQERLADVEASLKAPGPLETAIELPARLLLSPAQHALWRTPRSRVDWPTDPFRARGLWTADLVTSDPDPLVRAVHSPDLRPASVRSGLEEARLRSAGALLERLLEQRSTDANAHTRDAMRTPVQKSPPRGPRAPWTLGVEESGPNAPDLVDLFRQTQPDAPKLTADQICDRRSAGGAEPPETQGAGAAKEPPPALHPLLDYLCHRRESLRRYGRAAVFRSTLDAFDRHELVLLSSAYGLPVRGKRERSGQLQEVKTSSQVDLPPQWRPIDVEAGTAVYRPRPLQLQELRLSTLGGTLRHDTGFVPPSSARHLSYGPLFDSLSIERWQHWTVLGRDVFAEVVYKGYLFPIGHRASLVKQTERIFLRHASGKRVRAFLRQRMFIRIGQPNKAFPALGQPNGGRQFPASVVRMLTETTPDIVDPSEDWDIKGVGPAPGGRLQFGNLAGLAFWPRTARIPGTEVRFECQIEQAVTSSPFVFVDNTSANQPELLRQLVEYYNGIGTPDRTVPLSGAIDFETIDARRHHRTLEFGGQSQRYCDELKPGASSHKTLSWTLKATGCAATSPPKNTVLVPGAWEGTNTLFDEPSLEGAEQPPFYPALETARIRIDQIERMSGGAPQVALVQFDGYYIANGFEASAENQAKDPLQIYLNVLNPIEMSMGDRGDRSGGVFRPNSLIAALTRQRGPLNGNERVSLGSLHSLTEKYIVPAAADATNVPAIRNSFPKAGDKDTSPGKLLQSKILGLVSIGDLLEHLDTGEAIKSVPVLREVVEYGVAGVQSSTAGVVDAVIGPLRGALEHFMRAWEDGNGKVSKLSAGLVNNLGEVFPDVHQALLDLQRAIPKAGETGALNLAANLAEVYESGRRLIDACARAASNPLDRIQEVLAGKLGQVFKPLEKLLEATLGTIATFSNLADLQGRLVVASRQDLTRLFGLRFPRFVSDVSSAPERLQGAVAALQQLDGVRQAVANGMREALRQPFTDLDSTALETARAMFSALEGVYSRAGQALGSASEEEAKVLGAAKAAMTSAKSGVAQAAGPFTPDLALIVAKLKELMESVRAINSALTQSSKGGPAAIAAAVLQWVDRLLGPARWLKVDEVDDLLKSVRSLLEQSSVSLADPTTKQASCPAAGDSFRVPSDWRSPSRAHRVLAAIHAIAESAHEAFEKALGADTKLPAEQAVALRAAVSRLGSESLRAQCEIQDAVAKLEAVATTFRSQFDAVGASALDPDRLLGLLTLKERATAIAGVERTAALLREAIRSLKGLEVEPVKAVLAATRRAVDSLLLWQHDVLSAMKPVTAAWATLEPASGGAVNDRLQRNIDAVDAARRFSADASISNRAWIERIEEARPRYLEAPTLDKDVFAALVRELGNSLAGRLRAWWRGAQVAESQAATLLGTSLQPLLTQFEALYRDLKYSRDSAWRSLDTPALVGMRDVLLIAPDRTLAYPAGEAKAPSGSLSPADDQLTLDRESLKKLLEGDARQLLSDTARREYLDKFLFGWSAGTASPVRIAQQLRRVSIDRLRAMLLGMIDFGTIREEIEESIKRLIPVSAKLSYDFNIKFNSSLRDSKTAIFAPATGCALNIQSNTIVDLQSGTPRFSSVGTMGAFDIHLIGKEPGKHALSLHFKGLRFAADDGPFHCDLQYAGLTMGPLLDFLEKLKPFFGSKEGGFYLAPLDGRLGLEAGYTLNLGTITLGNVSFFNVSMNAATRLPFDDSRATFVASLSRRDAPFTISFAPYGGSGFFALEADTEGIVGFEASFEYGGAGAFDYGPLKGQGRLMTGIYVRSTKNSSDLSATFYAGGSASIWIFSLGASLYVTARPVCGKLVGVATYTFSFSVGFSSFDYRVQVKVELNWGGGRNNCPEQQAWFEGDHSTTRLAAGPMSSGAAAGQGPVAVNESWVTPVATGGATTKSKSARAPAELPRGHRVVNTVCPGQDWARYASYFDLERPCVEEFE